MTLINKNAKQLHAPIVSNKRVGQYHQIIINIGEVAATCKPGNFVAISVGGDSSRMVLRRAFAISRVSTSSTVGGTMELIVAPHGQGSKWLCQQGEGVVLDQVPHLEFLRNQYRFS
jgi:dihydroorotate dehydrogenase electron transfer subunit